MKASENSPMGSGGGEDPPPTLIRGSRNMMFRDRKVAYGTRTDRKVAQQVIALPESSRL